MNSETSLILSQSAAVGKLAPFEISAGEAG